MFNVSTMFVKLLFRHRISYMHVLHHWVKQVIVYI
jgi:hypothetical protein